MATNITLKDEMYNKVAERAKAANTTPEDWLTEAAQQRMEREGVRESRHSFADQNRKRMAALGVKLSDVEREIADYRRGR
jgi:hypothetical protein